MQTNQNQSDIKELIRTLCREAAVSHPYSLDMETGTGFYGEGSHVIYPDEAAVESLALYFQQLALWNRITNLTGLKSIEDMVRKHLGDTLFLLSCIPVDCRSLMDIGTGPGIPGLLLKLLRPSLHVILVDAVRKKCSFLRQVISLLHLYDVHVENIRISPENPPANLPSEGVDLICSQATGSLLWFYETASPFLAPGGVMVAMKGRRDLVHRELQDLRHRVTGISTDLVQGSISALSAERTLVIIRKEERSF